MSNTRNAFDFLDESAPLPKVSTCVVFGPEAYLKRLTLQRLRHRLMAAEGHEDEEVSDHVYDGDSALWRDVADELSTMSLFGGGGRRVVVVDDADKFVSNYRDKLEDYVAKTHKSSVLVLVVDAWAANTRLYKAVDQAGLQIECRLPAPSGKGGAKKGAKDEVDEERLAGWLVRRTAEVHDAKLARDAAQALIGLIGPELGLLDQELAKLSVLVDRGGAIDVNLVKEHAGGWRTKTTWELIDAATGGDAAESLRQLDQLLQAGQEPIAIMGAVGWSLRRFALAARLFERAERQRQPIPLAKALTDAGVSRWGVQLQKAERQMTQIGRQRAGNFYRWLLDVDLSLKSSHSSGDRARWQLEQLFVRLSKQLDPRRKA